MKTEAEARKCWCPFMRVPFSSIVDGLGIAVAVNNAKTADDEGLTRCIASECMAWRWTGEFKDDPEVKFVKDATGYCGLAGKP